MNPYGLSYEAGHCDPTPDKKLLEKGRTQFVSQFGGAVHPGEEGPVAGAGSSCSPCTHSPWKQGEMNTSAQVACVYSAQELHHGVPAGRHYGGQGVLP